MYHNSILIMRDQRYRVFHIGGPTFNPLNVVWGNTPPKGLLRQASVHRNQSLFIGGTVESNPDSPPIFENNWLCFRRGFQVLHQLSTYQNSLALTFIQTKQLWNSEC